MRGTRAKASPPPADVSPASRKACIKPCFDCIARGDYNFSAAHARALPARWRLEAQAHLTGDWRSGQGPETGLQIATNLLRSGSIAMAAHCYLDLTSKVGTLARAMGRAAERSCRSSGLEQPGRTRPRLKRLAKARHC